MKPYLTLINPLFDWFLAEMKITIALFDLRGNCITHRGGGKEFCCAVRLHFDKKCREEDENAFTNALQDGKPHRYRCHAGLTEIVFPLLDTDGTVVGFIIIGKFREKDCVEEARAVAQKAIRGDARKREAALADFEDLPTLDENEIRKALALLREIAQMLRDLDCLQSLHEPEILQTIDIEKAPRKKKLTCAQLYESLYTTRHPHEKIIRKACGETPSRFLDERRLVRAEDRLMNTDDSIEKIAEDLGYEPLSFTAFFKRHCGIAPQKFRKNKQRPAENENKRTRKKHKDDTTLPF